MIDIRGEKRCGEIIEMTTCYDNKAGKLYKKPVAFNLYNGNAYLVAVHEYREDGHFFQNLHWWCNDEKHMKRMLGLMKRLDGTKENMFEDGDVIKVTLYKNCRDRKKIASIFAEAFENLTIELKEAE